jgi:steroid delta-isomerase-like uncharacterized protein
VSPDDVRELMRRNIEELWGQSRRELIPELYAPDCVDHNPVPGQAPGHAGLYAVMDAFSTAFPDLAMTLHGTLADGDFGVDFWTFRATHSGELMGVPATGRRVEFSGIDVVRVGPDGRIAEIWHVEDLASMLTQLGVLRLGAQPAPVT